LLLYRRPALLQQVFDAVAAARPARLLLVADGPRDESERADCAAARRIVERVDWPCEVQRLYADTNLGCKHRVASGLDWVFSQVEEAIILEEDCVPDPSFFTFCEELLARYRNDERVFGISGANLHADHRQPRHSYHFSSYSHIWGWATWRRAWRHYDVDMKSWPAQRAAGLLDTVFDSTEETRYWRTILDTVHSGAVDTWDYQLLYAMWSQKAWFAIPEVNLVSNIGFGPGATHTLSADARVAALPAGAIGDLDHPDTVDRDREADRLVFANAIRGPRPRLMRRMLTKIRETMRL